MRQRNSYAFTLIELMIVIAIIGILSGIMVPNFMQARKESYIVACEQNLTTIAKGMEMLAVRNPQFVNTNAASVIRNDHPLIELGYLQHAPKCPMCNCYYKYCQNQVPTKGQHFWIEHENNISHTGNNDDKGFPIYDSKCGIVADRAHWKTMFDKDGK